MYPGGKNNCYQQIINLIPPHDVYIEPFLGSGAVLRNKRPSRLNIGVEIDSDVLSRMFPDTITTTGDALRRQEGAQSPQSAMPDLSSKNGRSAAPPPMTMLASSGSPGDAQYIFINDNALSFLSAYPFTGDEFVYCDPPYLMATRKSPRPRYAYEFETAVQHQHLLDLLLSLPCNVMLSGYDHDLYNSMLAAWHTHTFTAQTRQGTAVETLWMNYPQPTHLHDYRHLGDTFRERERIKRKAGRWLKRFQSLPLLERQAIISQLHDAGILAGRPTGRSA